MSNSGPIVALFYVQCTRSSLGNAAVWWAKGGGGYTANLDDAHVYTETEIRARRWRCIDVPRPKDEVDAMATSPRRAEGQLPPMPAWVNQEGA